MHRSPYIASVDGILENPPAESPSRAHEHAIRSSRVPPARRVWTADARCVTLKRMRPVYLALAGLFFVLAVLGVFLPVLPTTPFLLLTSACLVRSSPRLNERLRRSPLLGPFLRDWEKHHGVRLHVKLAALTLVALVVAWSLLYRDLEVVPRVVMCALALIGAIVVLRLKTVRGDG